MTLNVSDGTVRALRRRIELPMTEPLKSWPAPWEGEIVLACRKCQKKLKKQDSLKALARLGKSVKRRNRHALGTPLHVIRMACTKLCPKDGVTICLPSRHPGRLSILRSESDIDALYD